MDFLTVVTSEGQQFRHEFGAGALRIGRASGNDLVLHDLNVSRSHAEIVRRPDGWYLLDSGGKNGSFLNDTRIESPARLKAGDRVRVGTTTLIFNDIPQNPVEWSDRPLTLGGGTMILPVSSSPAPDLPDSSRAAGGAPGAASIGPRGVRRASPSSSDAGRITGDLAASSDLNIFIEADNELVFHRPLPEILETIMDLARRAVPFERGLLMLLERGSLTPKVVRVPPDEAGRAISVSRTITDRVLKRQESVLTSDAQVDFKGGGPSVEGLQIRSVACVPLWDNREVIGLIYVDSRHRTGLFTAENLRVLTHLANIAAVKIENARLYVQAVAAERMEQELEKAAEIQNLLLPSVGPSVAGYLLHGSSIPCRSVGGDYFDFIELPDGRLALALGDVAGKGLPAALLMCAFQASLRALTELDLPPEETVARLNRLLARRLPSNRFVTFFYGVLDPARHRLTYANAGHNPAWILRREGRSTERLTQTGGPLGLFEKAGFKAGAADLHPGDILLAYSDGVTEGTNAAEEEFGEARLLDLLRDAHDAGPSDIITRITADLERFEAGAPRLDDVTVVVLKRTT